MLDSIKKSVYEALHRQPYTTEETVKLNDIVIPYSFTKKRSKPKDWKMERARSFYLKKGYIDEPIIVKKIKTISGVKYLLQDSYTRYITLRNYNAEFAPIKYIVT